MKHIIRKAIPASIWDRLSLMRQGFKRANIVHPTGMLDPLQGVNTFVMVVGATFDQERPDAMMTCRMGYCHAFEQLGVPYLIVDIRDVREVANSLPAPILMFFGGDMHLISDSDIKELRSHRCLVWLYPWFKDSERFFATHSLDPRPWTLAPDVRRKILALEPNLGFTATVPSGLCFFAEWQCRGVPVESLPLACDTYLYRREATNEPEFSQIKLAFVGGYWESKGRQIDQYLRQFEDILVVYGYSKWPYRGYRGKLDAKSEPALYRQARVSPAINEPTVALLKGQINERVFKVMGSFGCTVVDAVPAYRELFAEDELLVADNPDHFRDLVVALLTDDQLYQQYRLKGHVATLNRHTYLHRVRTIMSKLCLNLPADQGLLVAER
jgi:hypothetical protein